MCTYLPFAVYLICVHLTLMNTYVQVEAKLEQEAEEPHVPLDLAFKQGETIKVKHHQIPLDHAYTHAHAHAL